MRSAVCRYFTTIYLRSVGAGSSAGNVHCRRTCRYYDLLTSRRLSDSKENKLETIHYREYLVRNCRYKVYGRPGAAKPGTLYFLLTQVLFTTMSSNYTNRDHKHEPKSHGLSWARLGKIWILNRVQFRTLVNCIPTLQYSRLYLSASVPPRRCSATH